MRKDKEIAIELRKSGKSYRQIRDELQIPLATLSDWFGKVDWSGAIRIRLTDAANAKSTVRIRELDRIRGEHLARLYGEARDEAREDLRVLKYHPLFIAGLMLYWGEGDKTTKNQVRLANSDPELIRLYVAFLEKACRIPTSKIRLQIIIYPDIDEASNKRFWSFASGVPIEQFTKSTLIKGRHKTKRLKYGVCNVVVSSTYFKVKVLEWLKHLPGELMEKGYYESIAQ